MLTASISVESAENKRICDLVGLNEEFERERRRLEDNSLRRLYVIGEEGGASI